MAKNWGLKITKPGETTTTTDPTKMLLSSKYQMFKYHQDSSVTATLTPGDTSATGSVTHGLGYVPAFIPYSLWDEKMTIIPSLPYGVGFTNHIQSWADNDKIYFKINIPGGWNKSLSTASTLFTNYLFDADDSIFIGKPSGNTGVDNAIRFTNVFVAGGDTITNATLKLKVTGGSGNGRVKWKTYGMDEDNTAHWTTTSPMNRPKTSASTSRDISRSAEASPGNTVQINVTGIVNEIKARGGWSSGNAMGFMFIDNGGDSDNYFNTGYYNYVDQELVITKSGDAITYYRALIFKDQIAT